MPDFSTYPNNRQKLTDKTDAIPDSSPALTDKIPDIFTDRLTKGENEFLFAIYPYLCEHGEINNYRAQALTGKSADSAKKYFAKLVSIGFLKAVGNNKARVYRLASSLSNVMDSR
jgi:Fic family protein